MALIKHPLLLVITIALFSSCSNSQKEYPPYRVEDLNKLTQANLEAEVLEKMKGEAVEWMVVDSENQLNCRIGIQCIEERNECEITLTDGQVYFRNNPSSLDSISSQVSLFLTANQKLSEKETSSCIKDPNYAFYNFPFFSSVTRSEIHSIIERELKLLEEAEADENFDIAEFYEKSIHLWRQKLSIMNVLETNELKEIHPLTCALIKSKQVVSGFSPAAFEVLKGFLKTRNHTTENYLNCSYLDLYYRSECLSDPLAKRQLEAIETLIPIRLLDQSYMNFKGLYFRSKTIELKKID